jgi:hypothetical protein
MTKQERDRKRYETTRRLIRQAKSRPCHDCDVQFPTYIMEFDHLTKKRFALARHGRMTIEAVKAEIKKCHVVCSNCHKVRTYFRRIYGTATTTH